MMKNPEAVVFKGFQASTERAEDTSFLREQHEAFKLANQMLSETNFEIAEKLDVLRKENEALKQAIKKLHEEREALRRTIVSCHGLVGVENVKLNSILGSLREWLDKHQESEVNALIRVTYILEKLEGLKK